MFLLFLLQTFLDLFSPLLFNFVFLFFTHGFQFALLLLNTFFYLFEVLLMPLIHDLSLLGNLTDKLLVFFF